MNWNELRTEVNDRAGISKAYQLGQAPTVVVAQDEVNTKKEVNILDLITRLIIFLVISHLLLVCLFCDKRTLRVNLVFRMALRTSSSTSNVHRLPIHSSLD